MPSRYSATAFDADLGPAQGRYFGHGYRGVRHRLDSIQTERPTSRTARIFGLGIADYPPNWSTDAEGNSRSPHLSTIDALVLSVALVEAYLRQVDAINENAISSAWITEVDIRAGSSPFEKLDAIPLECTLRERSATDPEWTVSTFAAKVGGLSVALTLRHHNPARTAPPRSMAARRSTPAAVLAGPLTDRYRDTQLLPGARGTDSGSPDVVEADLVVNPKDADSTGLGSAYWPTVTFIDCLAAASQMAQIAIFSSTGQSRTSLSNLWMRRARFFSQQPSHPGGEAPVALEVTNTKSFGRGTGGRLCSVDVECRDFFGMRATASLAYLITDEFNV